MKSVQVFVFSDVSYPSATKMNSQHEHFVVMGVDQSLGVTVQNVSACCRSVSQSVIAPEVHAPVHVFDRGCVSPEVFEELL